MAFSLGLLRPLAAGTIAVGSILAGLSLAFGLVTPTQAAQLPTLELLGLLGLLALPPLTLWAMWADRNAAQAMRGMEPEPVRASAMIEAKPLEVEAEGDDEDGAEVENQMEPVEIHAPGRRAVRHRRIDGGRVGV